MKKTLQTPIGPYKYKFVPVYEGVKRIDKKQARENLELFRDILSEHNLKFLLAFGTLLGAVRSHDFISHDEDIDLTMMKRDMPEFLSLLPVLRDSGFEVIRCERRGFLSLMRKGEYMDIYFYTPYPDDPDKLYCCRDIFPAQLLQDTVTYEFLGKEYLIPRDYDTYLKICYGPEWTVPIVHFNFSMSPFRKFLLMLKQYVKAVLPESFVESRQREKDKAFLREGLRKIRKYTKTDGEAEERN